MATLQIAGIGIELHLMPDSILTTLIRPYMDSHCAIDHTIHVYLSHDFDVPKGLVEQASYHQRHVYESSKHIYIVAYNSDGICKQMIKHTKDYQTIEIYLHDSDSLERLQELEYVLTGLLFVELALRHNRLAIHASAILINDQALLFAASSGTGKSTHANYWKEAYNISFINDDKPLLYCENDTIYVAGSPWCGKEFLHKNTTKKLAGIVILGRGNNTIEALSNKDKIIQLLQHSVRPRIEELLSTNIHIIEQIITRSPILKYYPAHSISSVEPLYNYFFGGSL